MKLSDFDYNLPKDLIAQYPLKDRASARLLVLNRETGVIEHRIFKDVLEYFKKDDVLILNDTKVLPSRLYGKRATGGKVEVFLLRRKEGLIFEALISPARVKLGEEIIFNGKNASAVMTAKNEVTFKLNNINEVYGLGNMPLPPYIKRMAEELDDTYYQTVYAKEEGAVAAPTAGLHFTNELISQIQLLGVNVGFVTLHVGQGTFKPVKTEDIREHKMDEEYFRIGDNTQQLLKDRPSGARVFAVGTTAARALETYALGKTEGQTDLFIYPGFEFKLVDCLLTNFHLPRTTLFMLTCAFGGEIFVKEAYKEAINKGYRFYSYGDAMLII